MHGTLLEGLAFYRIFKKGQMVFNITAHHAPGRP